jgi:peptide/nickel transport system substrate-binding protein
MRRKPLWVIGPGLIAAITIALALSSCGSSSTNTTQAQSQFAPLTAPPDNAQKGGTLTVLSAGDVDHIDPGAAYYQYTYMITEATDRTLMAWQPDDTANPTPDLAAGQPTVSSDNKTVTFKIKPGIKYSPPLGGGPAPKGDVTSADVKYAIDRGLMPGVANGYMGVYMGDIVGFKQAQAAVKNDPTKAPDISGIQTPDSQTIVFKLTQPTGPTLVQALSLPISAPVPEAYAAPFDAQNPSTYGEHQVSTGPYRITNYEANKNITLERNPNWNPSTDWRPAYVDKVIFQEGFSDTVSASTKILTGSDMVNGDFTPPAEGLKEAATKYPAQLSTTPSGANRYVALNTTKPPFNNIDVRKAVVANSDRTALRAPRGGELSGQIATHFIPPGIPGFDQAGGVAGPQGSQFDFVQNPTGNPQLAASYMKKAGFPSGKCTGSNCTITMVGDNSPPGSDTSQVVKSQLTQLGFKVNLQPVNHDVMYTKFCDVPKNTPNVCPNVAWGKDFTDPQSILDPTFNGSAIVSSNNSNWPLLNDKAVNNALDKARLLTDPTQRAQTYGKIDDQITALAPAIPWLWDNQGNIESKNVNGVINLFNSNADVSFTSLQQ